MASCSFARATHLLPMMSSNSSIVSTCLLTTGSSTKEDDEGHWVKHKGKLAVHGFKAHVGADADTALVEEVAITPASVNDGRAGAAALPDDPGEVFADSAYRGSHFRNAVHAKGGKPRIVATAMWGRDERETLARLDAWNQPIHRVRGRIEKIFGTWKRCYGLRRMRWRGLAKASIQVRLTAIAYNLKRTLLAHAFGEIQGATENIAQRFIVLDPSRNVALDAAQQGFDPAQRFVRPLELFGVGVTLVGDDRVLAQPHILRPREIIGTMSTHSNAQPSRSAPSRASMPSSRAPHNLTVPLNGTSVRPTGLYLMLAV